jgi:hypothetical protein
MVNKQLKAGVIYDGPSLIDGQPIVAIATYSDKNTKTGQVLQTYILCKDIDPRLASKKGLDISICGDCIMRGKPTADPKRKIAKERECYVRIDQGPLLVWKSYQRGVYPMATTQSDRILLGLNRVVRVGTYVDPAAIPSFIWDQLLTESETWMAYTHQKPWRPDIAMQSADSYLEAASHWANGRRTFRAVANLGEVDKQNETVCPASKEMGRRVQCADCRLCKGSAKAKSIAIVQH